MLEAAQFVLAIYGSFVTTGTLHSIRHAAGRMIKQKQRRTLRLAIVSSGPPAIGHAGNSTFDPPE
jgi:hypothetical protein